MPKDKTLFARVSEGEWRAVRERAARAGCTASAYVRCAVAAYSIEADETGAALPARVGVDALTVRLVARELVRQGVNLNQAAHALNVGALAASGEGPGLSPSERRLLLEGVEDARLRLAEVARGLAGVQREFERAALSRWVEIPAPRKASPRAGRGGEGGEPCP